MKISILIPVYNESTTIQTLIQRVREAPTPGYEKEVVSVDDASSDATPQMLESIKRAWPEIVIVRHKHNLGKGAAIQTALERTTGDYILIQDADLEYNPRDYEKLLKPLGNGAMVVYGSRNLQRSKTGYTLFFWGGWFLTRLFNFLYRAKLTDINTGYKLFRTDVIRNLRLKEKRFAFCEEVTSKIVRAGHTITEVAIDYEPRTFREGKKIRFRDGVRGLVAIIQYRFNKDAKTGQQLPRVMQKRPLQTEFYRYVVVGGLAFAIHFGVLIFLTERIGIHYLLSSAIAFFIAVVASYTAAIYWVFECRTLPNKNTEFGVFLLIGIVGLLLNQFFLWVLTESAEIHYLISQIITTGLVFVWNFSARKFTLFR